MKHEPAPLWTIALLTIALTSPALAVDGVLEINQACAVNTGCFSGDAAPREGLTGRRADTLAGDT
jgi:hypothetical protein